MTEGTPPLRGISSIYTEAPTFDKNRRAKFDSCSFEFQRDWINKRAGEREYCRTHGVWRTECERAALKAMGPEMWRYSKEAADRDAAQDLEDYHEGLKRKD